MGLLRCFYQRCLATGDDIEICRGYVRHQMRNVFESQHFFVNPGYLNQTVCNTSVTICIN